MWDCSAASFYKAYIARLTKIIPCRSAALGTSQSSDPWVDQLAAAEAMAATSSQQCHATGKAQHSAHMWHQRIRFPRNQRTCHHAASPCHVIDSINSSISSSIRAAGSCLGEGSSLGCPAIACFDWGMSVCQQAQHGGGARGRLGQCESWVHDAVQSRAPCSCAPGWAPGAVPRCPGPCDFQAGLVR